MKKVRMTLVILITVFFCNKIYAQTEVLSATLQQGDKTSVLYGPNAFIDAIKLVKDSTDVINLSSGKFNAPTINKACIIYGAGFERDEERNLYPTIVDRVIIKPDLVSDDDGNMTNQKGAIDGLHIEGIYFSGCHFSSNDESAIYEVHNISFKRCYLGKLTFFYSGMNSCPFNSKVVNCVIGELVHFPNVVNFGVYNCIIERATCAQDIYNKDFIIKNCIIFSTYSYGCAYKDNIFISDYIDFDTAAETASFCSHNIATKKDYFKNIDESRNNNNWDGKTSIGIFGEDIGNKYNSKYTYKLKEGNASLYIGSDGKEVGLYGGEYPFSKIPSNPQILSKEIDVQTTTEGKLKVNVKIEAQP